MPFSCEACGASTFPELIPAVGDALRCPTCRDERPLQRPPLLIVTGTSGIGKSTLCARLAGTIPGAVCIDADLFAEDHVSVVPPSQDYPAFWRSMMRIAHEVAQNNVVAVIFSTMLPAQALANSDLLGYFDSAQFLCLTCPADELSARLARRGGYDPLTARAAAKIPTVGRRIRRWVDFDRELAAAAREVPTAAVLDAGRSMDAVEQDVRHWISDHLDVARIREQGP